MPYIEIDSLLNFGLKGGGNSVLSDDKQQQHQHLSFKDIRNNSSEDNDNADGKNLYQQKRIHGKGESCSSSSSSNDHHHHHDDEINDDDHALRAKLYDYYRIHNKHAKRRREHLIRADNGLNKLKKNDYYAIKSYASDYEHGLVNNDTYDIRLKVPFSALFVGKSKSGKTTLVLDIMNQWNDYTDDVNGEYFKRIYWIYGTENAKDFHKLNEIAIEHVKHYGGPAPRIQFFKGNLKNEDVLQRIRNIPEQSIVILDDLMTEMVKSEDISNVLTRESHHKGWCVILLWQDMFPTQQFARTIAVQCDYKYIFRDPARQDRLRTLCGQMFPKCSDKNVMFDKIWSYLTNTPPSEYPYVRINLRPDSPHELVMMASDIIRDKKYIKLGLPINPTKVFTF